MNEDFAALADLVGQLLAARWIEEQDDAQAHDQPDIKTSTIGTALNRSPDHGLGDGD